ncbi:WEB family protein At1g75720-like [Gastrolobium bilobum]|uniref:WEB family protein At1g75720-like n=1 Tax=Gastrolobium bilobum TaxID=150636 RepID=UPI002AB07ED4|nr:WEB family protein At1g75720-like [Gastrolobium bilobum]
MFVPLTSLSIPSNKTYFHFFHSIPSKLHIVFFLFVSERERNDNNINMRNENGVMHARKTEIDTRAPFRSVKEAVSLFGEKVLAGEVYATKLKQIHSGENENGLESSEQGAVTAELEETRQNLQKAKEESMSMAHCLSSLQEELEHTKQELQQLKQRETEKYPLEPEIEDVKIIENLTKFATKSFTSEEEMMEFQNKRFVTFANPPSVTHVTLPQNVDKFERHPSIGNKQKKKKPLIPLIGGIFSRKKGNQ